LKVVFLNLLYNVSLWGKLYGVVG